MPVIFLPTHINHIQSSPSILYQRGVYAPETFKKEVYYGLPMQMTDQLDLSNFIGNILKQIQGRFK